jgi:hypothetical protein
VGEPPLPSIEPVPTDVPSTLPFDLSWQGVVFAILVGVVVVCFYLALRDPDPLDTEHDPIPIEMPDDYNVFLPLGVGYDPGEECRPLPVGALATIPKARGRVAGLDPLHEETTARVGKHRAPELPRYIRSHRRPAPRWVRRAGAATGLTLLCAVAVVVGVVIVFLLEG